MCDLAFSSSVQFQFNLTNHIAILCSFAIQSQSILVVLIAVRIGLDCDRNWIPEGVPWQSGGLQQDFI